jgi:dTDP-4-amino-4,6-dideoxygalactose transaminase
MILMNDLAAQYSTYKAEIDFKVTQTLSSGWYINGSEVKEFEKEFANWLGVRGGVGVANGTEAIQLALWAAGVGPGDEVITVSHTAVATVTAIDLMGAVPVLVDVESETYTLDPSKLKNALSNRTKAVVLVHIYGHPGYIEEVASFCKENNLLFIEDCAQSHGAKYKSKKAGSYSDFSCFSFYPTKNLGAIGDGGFVASDRIDLLDRVRQLREYGWKSRYISDSNGMNSRLDELQAAILRVKLKYLDNMNYKRQEIAGQYLDSLSKSKISLPKSRQNCEHVYHLFVIRDKNRDELASQLKEAGVSTAIHYPMPIHLQPGYRNKVRMPGKLPVTEELSKTVLSLPVYPELTKSQVIKIVTSVQSFRP